MRIGVLGVYRPQFDQKAANEAVVNVQQAVAGVPDAESVSLPMIDEWQAEAVISQMNSALQSLDVLVVAMGTFVGADVVLKVSRLVSCPIILWTLPEPQAGGVRLSLNSLCGGLLTNHAFKRMGIEMPVIYGDPRALATRERLASILRAERAKAKLHATTIGIVGRHPPGYYPCDYDELELNRRLGVKVRTIGLEEAFLAADQVEEASLIEPRRVAQGLAGLSQIDEPARAKSLRAELGLRQLIRDQGLSAVAVECWPDYMTEYGGAVCWAMSRLIDDGLMAGCEADVHGTLTMIMCRELGGESPFFGDLVHVAGEDRLVFWHCGAAPLSLAGETPRASVHPNRKVGLTLDFALKGGPATALRLHHDGDGLSLIAIEGEAVADSLYFSGNTASLSTVRPAANVLQALIADGAEHHFAVGYGVKLADVESLGEALGMAVHVY